MSRGIGSRGDYLLQINSRTGKLLKEYKIEQCEFAHQVVRKGDFIFVANTNRGRIEKLQLPTLKMVGSSEMFSKRQRLRSIHPTEVDNVLWCILLGTGTKVLSSMVKVDLEQGVILDEIPDVGVNANSIVAWKEFF